MNLTSPATIKSLLKKYGARPSKGLGQNFLIDRRILEKIINAAGIKPDDTVIEVGPGIGTLTRELAKKAARVIAVEKDATMAAILGETLANHKNVEIINADILGYKIQDTRYKVVANLPYYITSPVIRKFLEASPPPEMADGGPPHHMVLMVQKEVAQRICAKPPHMSLLAISVQVYAKPHIVSYVSKNCFWPTPTVDSAIIEISQIKNLKLKIDTQTFFSVVRAGFSQPRKHLVNNLATFEMLNGVKLGKDAAAQWLNKCGIDLERRAQTLTIKEWLSLASAL